MQPCLSQSLQAPASLQTLGALMQPCLSQSLQAPVSLQILGAFTVPAALPLAVAAGSGCRSQAPLMQPCLSQSLQARRPHSPAALPLTVVAASLQTLGALTIPAALPLTVAAGPNLAADPRRLHSPCSPASRSRCRPRLQIPGAPHAALPLTVAAGQAPSQSLQPCLSQSLQAPALTIATVAAGPSLAANPRRPHSPCSLASHSRCRPQSRCSSNRPHSRCSPGL